MWIRSQDNGLYDIQGIYPPKAIYKSEDKELNPIFLEYLLKDGAIPEKYEMVGIVLGGGTVVLGEYGKKEEAIEVLDMIQNTLGYAAERYEKDGMDFHVKTFNVFQMPQEGEVK